MRIISLVLAAAAASLIPSQASAAAVCAGSVPHVYLYSSGSVLIASSWHGSLIQICNVKQEWKGVPPEVCYTWFSAVSTANAENQQIGLFYDELNSPAECTTLPTYGNIPAPVYVRLTQ